MTSSSSGLNDSTKVSFDSSQDDLAGWRNSFCHHLLTLMSLWNHILLFFLLCSIEGEICECSCRSFFHKLTLHMHDSSAPQISICLVRHIQSHMMLCVKNKLFIENPTCAIFVIFAVYFSVCFSHKASYDVWRLGI